jgi:alkylated DNA repair dioxygenase AlkB
MGGKENLLPKDGETYYYQDFLDPSLAKELMKHFENTLDWRSDRIRIFGKWVMQPRLVAWYGDPDAEYTYSGLKHMPNPWTPELKKLKKQIETFSGDSFNSVLANLYRNGKDSNGWHSDNEKELGTHPVIASLSLGETRDFLLKHKKTDEKIKIPLESGSLLLMKAGTQENWKHTLPKRTRALGPRINLTFRKVYAKVLTDV